MKLDKSRIVLFGALIVLVMVLMSGGFGFHGFGMMHGGSWVRWILFGLLFWFLFSRCGCGRKCGCKSSEDIDDESSEDSSEDSKTDTSENDA